MADIVVRGIFFQSFFYFLLQELQILGPEFIMSYVIYRKEGDRLI